MHAFAAPADMRKSFDSLSLLVTQGLGRDVLSGDLFLFVSKNRRRAKVLYWDGQGFCLFAKRLEKSRFTWPVTKQGSVTLTPAQLSMLLEGLEWRNPRPTWQPTLAG